MGQRPTTTYVTFPLKQGESFSLGTTIHTRGETEILEITPLTSANVDYLGAFTVWPRDLIDYGASDYSGPGFPSPKQRVNHPALGVVIPASELSFVPSFRREPPDLGLTFGFRIREGRVGAMNGVLIVYRTGGHVVRQHLREAIIACVKPQKNCVPDKLPGGADPQSTTLRELGVLKD